MYLFHLVNFGSQVDLKPDLYQSLQEKIDQDHVLQQYLTNIINNPEGFARPSYQQQLALVARLLSLEPRLPKIILAIDIDRDPDFDRYFVSTHLDYLIQARSRLAELDHLPGPIYTVGLSVGGAVALALAADRSDRIKGVVAYAPLLKIYGEERRQYVNLAGPLDLKELGWDPALRFPVGALTATNRFGAFVRNDQNRKKLSRIPTMLVLTENEDAADIETNQQFFQDIGAEPNGHRLYIYPTKDLVPHPMVDPTEVSRGMSNTFWKSLYQETFRFLTTGDISLGNISHLGEDPNLPLVPPINIK